MLKLKTISLTLQHCMPSIKRNSLYQDPGSSKNSLRTCQAETFSSVSWSAQYQNEKDPYRLKVNRNSLHHYRSSSEISSSTCQAETVRSLPWSGWAVPKGNADTYALKIHRNSSFKDRRCSKFHRVHAKKVQKWLVLCLGLAEFDKQVNALTP